MTEPLYLHARQRESATAVLCALTALPSPVCYAVAQVLTGFGAKAPHMLDHRYPVDREEGVPRRYYARNDRNELVLTIAKAERKWTTRSVQEMREILHTRGLMPHGPGQGMPWVNGPEPASVADFLAVACYGRKHVEATEAILRETFGAGACWAPIPEHEVAAWRRTIMARHGEEVGMHRPPKLSEGSGLVVPHVFELLSFCALTGRTKHIRNGTLPYQLQPVWRALQAAPIPLILRQIANPQPPGPALLTHAILSRGDS